MHTAERIVRRLRLSAPSEEAAGRVARMMEDALRCASLPGDGARLVVVRHLGLGRVAAGISSQALSRRIEEGTARALSEWVEPGDAAGERAGCVAFAGALQARTLLAVRLLRGEPCGAWYWRAGVAEFEPRQDAAANVRSIAWAIAGWPEAVAALPAWAAGVVRDAGAQRLAACVTAQDAGALLERAGLSEAPLRAAAAGVASGRGPGIDGAGGEPRAAAAPALLPRWLLVLLEAAGEAPPDSQRPVRVASPSQAPDAGPHATDARGVGRSASRQHPALPAAASREDPGNAGAASKADFASKAPAAVHTASALAAPAGQAADRATAGTRRTGQPLHGAGRSDPAGGVEAPHAGAAKAMEAPPDGIDAMRHGPTAHPWLQPTACGGLLFLLPVLQRLGLADWWPAGDRPFAPLVLRVALERLRAPADDPAWQLAARYAGARLPPQPAPAPPAWSDPLLAPSRGRADLAMRLQAGTSARQQAAVWLAAARCWLRRGGRIGVASLVLRPAQLACTATHADLHLELARADLRVRRLGLDLDPGWLPWYGRVVGFHYERSLQ